MHNTLITNRFNPIELPTFRDDVREHFEKASSFTDVILHQINTERIYDNYFENFKKGIILDIGGNIGLFSIYAQDGGNKVYALEPTPEHFELFKVLAKPYKNIKPFNIALSPEDGEVNFYICDANTTMNSINNKYGKEITVKGVRLDTFMKEQKIKVIDFIKVDIEGSEMIALTEEIINNVKDIVKVWFIEAHSTDGVSLEENRKILQKRFKDCGVILDLYRNDALVSNSHG